MFVQGSHTFAMFYRPRAYYVDDLFPIGSKQHSGTVGYMFALYGPTLHVAILKPYFKAR